MIEIVSLGKFGETIDNSFSRVMYDKNYFLYRECGLIRHSYCTDYDEVREEVHKVIEELVREKAGAYGSEIPMTCMEVYRAIQRDSVRFDKIFEGCRQMVEMELVKKFRNIDNSNGKFMVKVSFKKTKKLVRTLQ